MLQYKFLDWEQLIEGHRDQLERHGGRDGFIDENAVRAAMARAQFKAQYQPDADLADLAAAYFYALSTTQGFVDGNKRAAVVASGLFLGSNGFRFIITDHLLYLVAMSVANAMTDEETLAEIIRDHIALIPLVPEET